jgi:1-acyl-sn-glycerol-3-phosphate acyltransferase
VVWSALQCTAWIVFGLWNRLRARGIDHIPPESGGLFLVNHQSFLDPVLVGVLLRRPVSFLARDSLFHVPILRWILRHTYVIPIDRDSAGTGSIREAVRRMKHGFIVGVFPEGTRTSDGTIGELKPGFIALVRRSKLPVYPVGIAGAYEAMPRGAIFLRPRCIRLVYGEPIPPEQVAELSKRGKENELLELVRQHMLACQQEAEAWRSGIK